MSLTKTDVTVAAATWTNLYAAASITVGLPIQIINKGSNPVEIAYSVAAPTGIRGIPLYVGDESEPLNVPSGELGCWAYSANGSTYLSVQDAPAGTEALAASEVHIGEVSGKLGTSSASFTRPSDTTAYTALDVVGNTGAAAVLTFANASRVAGGSGYVAKVRLMTNQSTCTARFRLHLYHTAPTAIADNAQMALLWANLGNRVGHIDFDACSTEGTGSDAASTRNITDHPAFVCANGSTTLYGILETRDVFTPASAQQFGVELTLEQY